MRPEHIKNLNLFLGVLLTLLVLFVAVRSYTIFRSSSKLNPEGNLEMDPVVRATADSLENRMRDLAGYLFSVKTDPLKLSRVVVAEEEMKLREFRELEEEMLVRLSATVVDEEPKAVIKYKNRSYIVGIGDSLAGKYLVTDISYKRATLSRDGKEIFLESRPISEEFLVEPPVSGDSLSYQVETLEEF